MAAGVGSGSTAVAGAAAAGSAGSAPTAALAGVVPVGRLILMPAPGDVLAISLAFGFSGELEALFNGDDLRCCAAVVAPLPTVSWVRRALLAPPVGAVCVNLGAGRAVKVLVMVVVVVVLLLVALPLAVADLMRVVLVVLVAALLDLATPLASGFEGLRAPDKLPVVLVVGGLRSVEDTVLRGERVFGLAAAPVALRLLGVVAGLLAVTCRRDLVAAVADPLLHVVELGGLRAVAVLVVLVVKRAVVAGLTAVLLKLPAVLLAGAVAGRALVRVL